MFTVIYRWRLHDGSEGRFLRAWEAITQQFTRSAGSFGSRLHREPDGTLCAIALWPSRDAWSQAHVPPEDERHIADMRSCIRETFPTLTMDSTCDRWTNASRSLHEGYIDLPPGMRANVVTNLQMLERPSEARSTPLPFTIERLHPVDLARYRALFRGVGEPYQWFSRLRLDDDALREIVDDPNVEIYAAVRDGDIGILELDFRVALECEITFFGFVESAIGRGYGNALMHYALARAWERPTHRVWLHTCTNDHPKALAFYEKHGFKSYSYQVEVYTP